MSSDHILETTPEVAALLEDDDEQHSSPTALEDEQFSQTAALDDEQFSQTAALDDERPTSRSDAKDPWHGLNDFDED